MVNQERIGLLSLLVSEIWCIDAYQWSIRGMSCARAGQHSEFLRKFDATLFAL